jgi:diguanylate cyclase (GGDEF)-like protein/PAS domain S-box-containing protein
MVLRSQIRALPAALAYFAAASLCLVLTRYDGGVAFLWFAASVMIADLAVRPFASWPWRVAGMAVASALSTGLFGMGWTAALPFAAANMIEGLTGAYLLRIAVRDQSPVGSLRWLVKFVGAVGVAAPLAATLTIVAMAPIFHLDRWATLIHVFAGHALGNITFTPLFKMVRRDGARILLGEPSGGRKSEAVVLLSLVVGVTVIVFAQSTLPLLFLPLLPVILVSFRLGYPGAALAVVLVALIGAALTMLGHGPILLIDTSRGEQIQFLQFYLAAMVLTALPVAADLQNRSRLHRAMRLSEERYRLLAEHSTDILLHVEFDGRIRYVSPSIHQLGGYDAEGLIGSNAGRLVAPEHLRRVRQGHLATIAARGMTESFEYLALTRTGERRWFESHARLVIDEEGKPDGLLCVVRNIAVRKEKERELSHAALTDVLTGLPNRRAFEAAVEVRAGDRRRGDNDCVALFDIDRFKRVNDVHGHDVGDAVLQTFARVLRGVVRRGDVIARLGGEEFAVMFPNTAVPQALMVCERFREQMAFAQTDAGGTFVDVTVSGGVALLGPDGLEKALKQADRALYTAKRGGRDQMALAA